MSSEKDYSVLPEVIVIQESAKITSEEYKQKKLRVCAYARVSTEKEEQEYSFENQRDYYRAKILFVQSLWFWKSKNGERNKSCPSSAKEQQKG